MSDKKAKNPIVEVFGFSTDNNSDRAKMFRENRLCPYNNKVPNCTKDKANDPLGVCSIREGTKEAIICPVRFRQDWRVAIDAAAFFFPPGTKWTTLTEVRLNDANGNTAGNIDVVLVSYDDKGIVTDFGALEIQSVYISGNIRRPFEAYISNPADDFDWSGKTNYPRPDYLSSSRKRLVPQLIYKGKILNSWNKKIAVALHSSFYATLPELQSVPKSDAEIAWLIYDLQHDDKNQLYNLVKSSTILTAFQSSLDHIITPAPGSIEKFVEVLQEKLDEKLENQPHEFTLTVDNLL